MKTILFLVTVLGTNLLFSQTITTTEPTIPEKNKKIKTVESNITQKSDTNKTILPTEEVQTSDRGVSVNQKSKQSKFPIPIQEEKKEFIIPKKPD